jgi:hypothetical protein
MLRPVVRAVGVWPVGSLSQHRCPQGREAVGPQLTASVGLHEK